MKSCLRSQKFSIHHCQYTKVFCVDIANPWQQLPVLAKVMSSVELFHFVAIRLQSFKQRYYHPH